MSASVLTPKVEQTFLDAVRAGLPLETAARKAGISPATAREWVRRGEGRDERPATPELESFALKFNEADTEAEERALAGVQAAGVESWQAYAWFLERRWPRKYSSKVRETVEKEIADLFVLLDEKLDPDLFAQVVKVVAESKQG